MATEDTDKGFRSLRSHTDIAPLKYSSGGEISPTEGIANDNEIFPEAVVLYTWRYRNEFTYCNLINCFKGKPSY
jgi:hypothetical protein